MVEQDQGGTSILMLVLKIVKKRFPQNLSKKSKIYVPVKFHQPLDPAVLIINPTF